MGLFDLFKNKEKKEAPAKEENISYIREIEHIVGPWHQYDIILAARGYGWEYILDSAEYMIKADLMNIGTVSLSSDTSTLDKECIAEFRECENSIRKMDILKEEGLLLGVGGMSKTFGGMPLKIVWLNQTNIIRIMTPVDDEAAIGLYAETVIRRSFGTPDAMKAYRKIPVRQG